MGLTPEKAHKSNPFFSDDFSCWLDAVDVYIREGNAECLNLQRCGFGLKEVEHVLKLLRNSRLTELILEGNKLDGMKNLWELMKKTKIKKLNVSYCDLCCCDLSALVEILPDTKIVDLNATNLIEGEESDYGRKMVSCLLESGLISLELESFYLINDVNFISFAEGLPETSLTCLNMSFCQYGTNCLLPLFSKLPYCSIKDLNLRYILDGFEEDDKMNIVKALSLNLRGSKLEKLNLQENLITDAELDILAQGLVNSNITSLDLSVNEIRGLNNFGQCLKHTKIRTLDLSANDLSHDQMFNFPDFLKNSCVESLDISCNKLEINLELDLLKSLKSTGLLKLNLEGLDMGLPSITEMACILKDTNLENISFSGGNLSSEALNILASHLKESKLTHIEIDGDIPAGPLSCLHFLDQTKHSLISSVKMMNRNIFLGDAKLCEKTFVGITFTHFNVGGSLIGNFTINVAPHLKFTAITHLNLTSCKVEDKDVLIFAEYLKGTRIIELNLSSNSITSKGIRALADVCKETSLLYLDFSSNKIENNGIEILAEHLAGSFVTAVDVSYNPGNRILLIDKILYENRVRSHNFVNFFKRIAPEHCQGNFCFHHGMYDRNFTDILDEYLLFHKSVVEKPSAISVLLEDKSIRLSREELVTLLFETFPRQLMVFICERLEIDIAQRLEFLEKVERLGLVSLVELLLLNRPSYYVDETKRILHPYVYKLLLKYKQPVCNISVEPDGVVKIIEYFKEHIDVDGAIDLIHLLTGAKTV